MYKIDIKDIKKGMKLKVIYRNDPDYSPVEAVVTGFTSAGSIVLFNFETSGYGKSSRDFYIVGKLSRILYA